MSNQLKLSSPAGADPVIYYWPLCKTKQYNGAEEILETIKWVTEDYPELKIVLEKYVLTNVDLNSYDSMKQLCDKYNKGVTVIRNLWKGATKPNGKISQWASPALLRHIITQCYNRSVVDPDKLNQYEPFSPEVYGETSFELISKMLEDVKLSDYDIFVDLGSGVGQVVIQVAGSSKVSKCLGIEKSEVPSEFAANIEKEFRKWMKWYGKRYQEFELIKGDFFDSKFRDTIMNSSLIFVNNFAFGPEVDHKLKLIFAEMKDGTKIVSSKAYCPINFRITDRHMTELGSIMNVKELSSMPGAVSWTGKPVTYFLHTIDRTKLESYFNSVKNNGNGSANNGSHHPHGFQASSSHDAKQAIDLPTTSFDSGSCDVKSTDSHEPLASSSHPSHPKLHHRRTSSKKSASNDEEEGVVYGPTTRRQWSSWVEQQERMKRKNQDKDIPSRSKKRRILSSVLSSRRSAKSPPTVKSTVSSENDHIDDDNSSLDDDVRSRIHLTSPTSCIQNPSEHHHENVQISIGNVVVSPITSVDDGDRNSSVAPSSPAESLMRRNSLQQPARKPGRPRKIVVALAPVDASLILAKADATKRKYRRRHHHHQKFSHVATKRQNLTPRKLATSSEATSEELIRRRQSQSSSTAVAKVSTKKKSAEWIETLDLFHQQIVYNAANAGVEDSDKNGIVSSVSKIQSPKTAAALISLPSSYPQVVPVSPLTTFMENIRKDYEQFLSHMQSSDFRNEIMTAIENEQKRQKSLQHRKELLEKQVQILQEEGTQLLTVKLQELDMKVVTPTELLSKAKEIVIQHQDLQARAAALENEVKNLELQNQQLNLLTKSNEEAKTAQVLHASSTIDSLHDDAKKSVLVEIGSLFTHRKAYLNEISRMENEIRLLESLVQMNAANTGLSDSSILKSPLASIAGLSQAALHQTPLNVLSSPAISTNKNGAGNSPTSAAVAAAQYSRAALATAAKDSSSSSASLKEQKVSGRNVGDSAPSTTTVASGGRRLRGGRSGRGGSTATGLRRKHATTTSAQNAAATSGSGSTASSGATSVTHGTKTPLDVQRRDDIDEQVEEMVRKIKNMNSAVTSNLTTISQDKDKKSKTLAASSLSAIAASGPSCTQKVDSKKLPRRREKKQAIPASSTAGVPTTQSPIPIIATPTVVAHQPSTIEQTVDAVSHGFSSSSTTMPLNIAVPIALTSAFSPATTSQLVAVISHPLTINDQTETAERWHKSNAASLSSVTDSLPSPDQETSSSAQNLIIPMPESVGNQFSSIEQDAPLSLVTCQRRPSSVPVFPCHKFSVLQQTASSSSAPPSTRPLATQPPPSSSASSLSCQAPSPFSIGALLIDERPPSSSSSCLPAASNSFPARPEETAAQPRRVQSASARMNETSSVHDSGYAESLASTSATVQMEFEPAKEKISSPNLFKNTSNTGQPGNPHEYSNPGNPQVKQHKSIGLASTSSSRSALTPAKKLPRRVVADDPSPQDVIESKTLLNPLFRIPRRVAQTPESTYRNRETSMCHSSTRADSVKRQNVQPLMAVNIVGADSRSPLANRMDLSGRGRPVENVRKRKNWQHDDSNTPKRRILNSPAAPCFNPVDQIMQDMILPMKKMEEKDSQTSSISSDSGGVGKGSFPRVSHLSSLALTRESLERHVSQMEGHRFIKQGLMEALLEHKMASGRVESYSVLAPKLDRYFSKADAPVKYDPILDDFESQHSANKRAGGPQTPTGTPPVRGTESQECDSAAKRGPKTPPCTPPSSPPLPQQHRCPASLSSYSNYRGGDAGALRPHRSMSISSAAISTSPPPVQQSSHVADDESDIEEQQRSIRKRRRRPSESRTTEKLPLRNNEMPTARNDILGTLADMANIDPAQVSQLLSADALKALQGLDPAILVATLSTLLGTIMRNTNKKKKKSSKKKESHAADDASSSKHQVPHITSTCEMDEAQPSITRAPSLAVEEEMDLVESSSSLSSAADVTVKEDVGVQLRKRTTTVVLPPPAPPVETANNVVVPNFLPPPKLVLDVTRPPPMPAPPQLVDFSVPPPNLPLPSSSTGVDFSKPPPSSNLMSMLPPAQEIGANNNSLLNEAIYKLNAFTMNILYQLPHDALSYLGADIVDYQPLDRFCKDYNHERDPFFGNMPAVQPPPRSVNVGPRPANVALPPLPAIVAPPPIVRPPPAPLVVPIRHAAPPPRPVDLMSQPVLPPFPLPLQRPDHPQHRISGRSGSY